MWEIFKQSNCKHRWIEVKRVYVEPAFADKMKNLDEDLIRDLVFGFTNIEQQCSECGLKQFTKQHGHI